MGFNPEITLTTVVSVVTLIFVAGGFYFNTRALFGQVSEIKQDLKLLNKVVMDVAVQSTRLDNLEKRNDDRFQALIADIREMKHGKGFIKAG